MTWTQLLFGTLIMGGLGGYAIWFLIAAWLMATTPLRTEEAIKVALRYSIAPSLIWVCLFLYLWVR